MVGISIFYCIAALFLLTRGAIGCRCGIPEERDRFCAADFAVVVRVEDNGQIIENDRVYRVTELMNIKPATVPYNVIRNKVFTATQSAACGVLLDKKGIYLLAGSHQSDGQGRLKRYIGLCSVVKKLSFAEYKKYKAPKC